MSKNEPKYYASVGQWQTYLQKFSTKKITKAFAERVKKKREKLKSWAEIKKEREKIFIPDRVLGFSAKVTWERETTVCI